MVKKLRQVLAAKITTPSPNKRFFGLFLDGDDNDEPDDNLVPTIFPYCLQQRKRFKSPAKTSYSRVNCP